MKQKFNINLKVELLPLGNDGLTKFSAAAAANNLPDFFQITSDSLFLKWIPLGLVAPVDSLLPLMPGRTKDRYSVPTINKLYTINGKLYSLAENAGSILPRRTGFLSVRTG